MAIYPTAEQFTELLAQDDGRPVVMVNLLRYKPAADAPHEGKPGLEAYRAYGEAMVPFVLAKGGRLIWAGDVASTWATATASAAGSATATSAVSAWASAVAASTARSDATVRTSSASGTRNATSTSEVVAATSSSTRLRTGQSPVRRDGSAAGVSTAGPGAAMRTPTPRTLCR